LLWVVVALLVGFAQHRQGLLESSTWVACLALFAGVGGFLYVQEALQDKDLRWNLVFQLQVVGVPLAVLLMAAMGVRSYAEVVVHFLILSTGVNCLWLQGSLQGNALYISKLLTVAPPLISLYMVQFQLRGGWEFITAAMAGVALAPLLVMPVILDSEALDPFQLRLGSLCTTGALLSTIVNLGML
jgi:hypothetical protein